MSLSNLSPFFTLLKVLSHCFSSLESFQSFVILFKCFGLRELMFFFSLNSFHNTRLFFFPSCLVTCLVCFVWLPHGALHPISTIVLTPTIDVYSHLLPPSPFAPTCLLPLTFAIVACSYLLVPTYLFPLVFAIVAYFCHYHMFWCLACFYLLHHLLSPSPPSLAYFYLLHHLLSPSPPSLIYFRHHCLFMFTSTIATYLFSPLPPILAYFHHCHLHVFTITAYFQLLPSLSHL